MKISNDSNTFIKNELKSEIKNYAVCAAILVFLGLFSLVCTVRSNITLIKVSAVVSIVTGLCVLVFGFIYYSKRQNALKNYIENFAFGVEDAAKAAVLSFPDPIVIISDDGIIEWYNKLFSVKERACSEQIYTRFSRQFDLKHLLKIKFRFRILPMTEGIIF